MWRPLLIQAALTFVAALGVFQIAALHNGLEGLAWLVGLRHKRAGYFLAGLLIALGFLGGLFLTPLPSLSSLVVFLIGAGLALLVALSGAALRLRWNSRRRPLPVREGKPAEFGALRATFYQPEGWGPVPALCLLPDPTAPGDDMSPLAQALIERGIAVLALDWQSLAHPDRLTLQGLVAVGISHLARWPAADARRIGLVGVGLGGDLALSSAAMDTGVAVALAIEPALSTRRPGLGLEALRAISWFEARRRVRRWRRSGLVEELDALTAIRYIASRPVAIVAGYADGAEIGDHLEIVGTAGGCPLVPAIYAETVERAAAWLTERLV